MFDFDFFQLVIGFIVEKEIFIVVNFIFFLQINKFFQDLINI